MKIRRGLDGRAVSLMIILCAILGMQQIVIKAAAFDMNPVLQMAIRSGIAALIVGVYHRTKGLLSIPANGKWRWGIAAGVFFTMEYFFVAEGLRFTNASRMVTMLYTAPAFVALCLHFLIPEERLRPLQWSGMALSLCGVAIAFYEKGGFLEISFGSILFGDFLGLLAGMSWAASTVVIRAKLSETPATQTAFIQLLTCFCILLPGAALTGRFDFSMSSIVWVSLAFQVLMICIVCMVVWFWLLTVYPASQLGVLCFLTPVFGIVFGVALLGESVEPKFILGAALVLAGIILVSGGRWFSQHAFHKHGLGKAWKPRAA